ncbi:MAG: thiol-disulfide oxidoreductase DCC family protein [Oleispira sp.]|nr:thiol-disulfide oxidoreductase DCC family protein [Oleispira sp.]MBL4879899.1 thiol-disulfide oxidoreductase DCC family protein [Oleispira sp.]
MNSTNLPPNVSTADKVILFDGVCKLCNAWSNFIIQHDHQHVFKLCSVQSDEGQKILKHFGLSTDVYASMLVVEGDAVYQQSDAFFQVVVKLGYPWKIVCVFRMIPKSIRNWLYDRIALNRYRLFGKYDVCLLPTADHEARYLSEK